jgi:hypothetical protein
MRLVIGWSELCSIVALPWHNGKSKADGEQIMGAQHREEEEGGPADVTSFGNYY